MPLNSLRPRSWRRNRSCPAMSGSVYRESRCWLWSPSCLSSPRTAASYHVKSNSIQLVVRGQLNKLKAFEPHTPVQNQCCSLNYFPDGTLCPDKYEPSLELARHQDPSLASIAWIVMIGGIVLHRVLYMQPRNGHGSFSVAEFPKLHVLHVEFFWIIDVDSVVLISIRYILRGCRRDVRL